MGFLTNLINGLSLGSVYAIIALGYTMVYGIAKMLNFAHGDIIMVGGYVCFCAVNYLGLPTGVGVLLSIVACTVLGIVIERLAYKPLRNAPSLDVLITAIGVSYFLQNAALLIWGSDTKSFPSVVNLPSVSLFDGQLVVSAITIVTVIAGVVVMVGLTMFTGKTRMGKAMRACSEDRGAATLMGINVNSTISLTFAIGSGLAAVAGVLMCSAYPTLIPTTGSLPGIKAFTAAVIGGIGSIPGAFVGGLVLVFVVLGGMGNVRGSIISAAVLTVLPEMLRAISDWRMLIYAVVLILVMIVSNNPTLHQFFETLKAKFRRPVKVGQAEKGGEADE